jgi:predicted nucleotidyltransferase
MNESLQIDREKVAGFCRRRHISEMSLYGSVLRDDFRPESDVDVLVEFEPGHVPGLFTIARMERELSAIFGGRKVDLRTPEDLSRYFRDQVMERAEVQYARGKSALPGEG